MRLGSVSVFAVDWSGDARLSGQRNKIWLVECIGGQVVDQLQGLTRSDAVEYLIGRSRVNPEIVVGFDFAFSFPQWFLDALHIGSGPAAWDMAATRGESWLKGPVFPFWRERNPGIAEPFRTTELEIERLFGLRPESVFKLVGAKQVGPGSVRGMPYLTQLRAAGFSIWPFDASKFPVAIEIWPRVLMQKAVVKSDLNARRGYLQEFHQS